MLGQIIRLALFFFTVGAVARPCEWHKLIIGTKSPPEPALALKGWEFGDEREAKLRSIFQDDTISAEQQFARYFEEFWKARLETTNPVTRFLMRRPLADALRQRSIYSRTLGMVYEAFRGPHYNPIFNRIGFRLFNRETPADLLVASHELGHAYNRNTVPVEMTLFPIVVSKEILFALAPRLATSYLVHRLEAFGIGTQHELVRRIPEKVRTELKKKVEEEILRYQSKDNHSYDTSRLSIQRIMDESLAAAHLSKAEFIERLREVQGYDWANLTRNGRRLKRPVRAFAFALSLWVLLAPPNDPDDPNNQDPLRGVKLVPANDIKWAFQLALYLESLFR